MVQIRFRQKILLQEPLDKDKSVFEASSKAYGGAFGSANLHENLLKLLRDAEARVRGISALKQIVAAAQC